MTELVDHRYLGAISFLDRITGTLVTAPLQLAARGVTLRRNRSALYVITAAPDFDRYVASFNDPTPPVGGQRSCIFSCSDPAGNYLPRSFTILLPRDPASANVANSDSLFRPVEVPLYPTAKAMLGVNWSAVRVAVTRQGSLTPVRGALLRVVRTSDSVLLGSSFSDERGEALVAIAGIPVTDFAAGDPSGPATGPVVVSEVAATLEVSCNPASSWPLDCEAAEAQHSGFVKATLPLQLRTGRTETIPVSITL